MRRIRLALTPGALSVLTACAGMGAMAPKDQAQAIASVEAAYTVAAHAESAYLASGPRNPATVAQMKAYDEKAYSALVPLRQAAENGSSVATAAEIEAGKAAVNELSQFLAGQGIR